MKAMLLGLLVLAPQAFASHFMTCDVEATVTEVKNLARFDGVAVFARPGTPVKANHEQTLTVKVTNVTNVQGHGGCMKAGVIETLAVRQDLQGKVQVGQVVNFAYQNVGDAAGSRISWVVKP